MADATALGGAFGGDGAPSLPVTLVICLGPRSTTELELLLPAGATVADALRLANEELAAGACLPGGAEGAERARIGIWGRASSLETPLQPRDRVEVYRPLVVDPKVARRERFARQGARSTGLFARQRPGSKSGY